MTALRLGEIGLACGLPPGVVNIIPGTGSEAGVALASHPDINQLTFTGSVEVGVQVARLAAENVVPVVMELGGKSPNIVFADADFDLARYRRAMGVNLDGVVFWLHAALPALRARGGGAIVATSSLAGLTGTPYDALYSANKHAVVGLVRSLGPPLAQQGIRLNAICPGFAESAIIEPLRDMIAASGVAIIAPERIAEAVLELFAGDAGPALDLIRASGEPMPPSPIHSIPHLPLWHRDRMLVIGDAAHAPSPSSGLRSRHR